MCPRDPGLQRRGWGGWGSCGRGIVGQGRPDDDDVGCRRDVRGPVLIAAVVSAFAVIAAIRMAALADRHLGRRRQRRQPHRHHLLRPTRQTRQLPGIGGPLPHAPHAPGHLRPHPHRPRRPTPADHGRVAVNVPGKEVPGKRAHLVPIPRVSSARRVPRRSAQDNAPLSAHRSAFRLRAPPVIDR